MLEWLLRISITETLQVADHIRYFLLEWLLRISITETLTCQSGLPSFRWSGCSGFRSLKLLTIFSYPNSFWLEWLLRISITETYIESYIASLFLLEWLLRISITETFSKILRNFCISWSGCSGFRSLKQNWSISITVTVCWSGCSGFRSLKPRVHGPAASKSVGVAAQDFDH